MLFLPQSQNHLHVATGLLQLLKLTSQVSSKTLTESQISKAQYKPQYEALPYPTYTAACKKRLLLEKCPLLPHLLLRMLSGFESRYQ